MGKIYAAMLACGGGYLYGYVVGAMASRGGQVLCSSLGRWRRKAKSFQ